MQYIVGGLLLAPMEFPLTLYRTINTRDSFLKIHKREMAITKKNQLINLVLGGPEGIKMIGNYVEKKKKYELTFLRVEYFFWKECFENLCWNERDWENEFIK